MYKTKFYCESFDRYCDESHFKWWLLHLNFFSENCSFCDFDVALYYIKLFIEENCQTSSQCEGIHWVLCFCLNKTRHLKTSPFSFWNFSWTYLLFISQTISPISCSRTLQLYPCRKADRRCPTPEAEVIVVYFFMLFCVFYLHPFCCVCLSVLFFAGLPLLHTSFRFGSAG